MTQTDPEVVRRLTTVEQQMEDAVKPEIIVDLISPYLALTGLRGFWPMSAIESNGDAFDQSGNGRLLTYNGNPTYNFDGLVPYIDLDGTGDFLSRADEAGLDILGTETYVAAGIRGLTCGGWFFPGDAATNQGLVTKRSGPVGNYSWDLNLRGDVAGDPPTFWTSDDGTNFTTVTSTVGYVVSAWHFIVARFNDADTGAELAIWVNNTKTTAASARNAIFNGNAALALGAISTGALPYTGRIGPGFLCAAAVSDVIIGSLFESTKAAYRVD